MKNFLTYLCKTLRITQSYTGTTSHLPHTKGSPKDYPWDEGCADSTRGWCYCPCDEMVVKRIYGVSVRGTNTIWLESTTKVDFADGTSDYLTMLITHPNDDDLKKIKVGQVFKRRQKICREGKDGATANHFHFSVGKGKLKGNGWTQNSKGKYVLTTTNGACKPEKIFYIDKEFTTVVNAKGLKFKTLPSFKTGRYQSTAKKLNVRKGPGTEYDIVPYEKYTDGTKEQLKKLKGKSFKNSYFVKGMSFNILETEGNWGRCTSGWVCLDYCKKIK